MAELVQKLVTADSFDARGVLVPAGHVASFDPERLNGEEDHIKDVGDFVEATIEMAAIAPSGPNPTTPQQISPDTVQGPGGGYKQPGKTVIGEQTAPADTRLAHRDPDAEAAVTDTLAEVMGTAGGAGATTGNADDALVAGTVAEVTADLGTKTNEQLAAMRAAENDRESPRKGVLSAIDEELEARKTA